MFEGEGRLNTLTVDVIMDLSPGDEISTLFVRYLGDDAIATGTKFRQKFSSFRYIYQYLIYFTYSLFKWLLSTVLITVMRRSRLSKTPNLQKNSKTYKNPWLTTYLTTENKFKNYCSFLYKRIRNKL